MQQTQLPAFQSNCPFQVKFSKSNTLWYGTSSYFLAPAATSLQKQLPVLHRRPSSCTRRYQQLPVMHQQLPALHRRPSYSSDYQFCISSCRSCTSDHLLAPADSSNYQSWTSEHLPAPADTSSQQLCTSNYQSWTSNHLPVPADTSPKPATIFLHQRPSIQRILVLYQQTRPAPATRSCSNDHHPASAIIRRTLFR